MVSFFPLSSTQAAIRLTSQIYMSYTPPAQNLSITALYPCREKLHL